jgi:hypothetical protein
VTPSDFYFAFLDGPDGPCVVVTPKKLWDSEGCWSDESEADDVLPPGFARLMESVYEYEGPRDRARARLLEAGYVENLELGS